MNLEYWAESVNKKEVFGHKDELYRTNQTFICGTGIPGMKIIKGKSIFLMLFLTSVDSNMADICLA